MVTETLECTARLDPGSGNQASTDRATATLSFALLSSFGPWEEPTVRPPELTLPANGAGPVQGLAQAQAT